MTDAVLDHALGQRDAFLARLSALVAQPSVGADPAYADGMESARRLLESRLADAGFQGLRRLTALDGSGQPAIYAEWLGAEDAPTLIVYGHYDVQPPDPLDLWQSPPFEATVRDGRLYGRGVSDDKGPMLIALEAMIAFLEVEGRLPVNVRLLLEGEEETGSPSLAPILAAHRDLLKADAVLSADGARWRADLTTINVGNRGNGGFEITVRTAAKDLHSGRYGGVVPNALHVLADLVSGLRDAEGRIVVPGFLDGVDEPSDEDRADIAAIPFDEAALLADLQTAPVGEPGFSFLERLWLRPTLEVNGMWGGYTGAGGKTVIPNTAHAKFTMRLVPGQDPDRVRKAVLDHLRASCPPGATLAVSDERGWAGAYAVPQLHPLLSAAEDALEETTGDRPIRVRIGATLPLTELVRTTLGLDTVMFSFSTADEDYHAPNEFLRLSAIDEGLAAWVSLLRKVGRQDPAEYSAFRP
ncbi:dipeptidase [Ovoidimarina sediminis]|uniref:dipeptidase n=1 Tax=Ovoidimarina sediminis TaxID=3079856 RepID=UPI00290A36CA|nr:dipeptidase [Rhodophyticola sp. MJ-SS7]MDU8946255.1 dipeptidase [Rhodophyticola sp. MJ-SS7]